MSDQDSSDAGPFQCDDYSTSSYYPTESEYESSDEGTVRVHRVSRRQLDILCEYLSSHREIAVAYNRTMQAKDHSRHKWMEVVGLLNAEGEAKLKRRVTALRSSQSRTGGGPSTEQPLTEIESKFLQILEENYGQGL
ncbi:uncharacterized protein ACR2FA_012823 [Aphomia sociella]